MNNLEPLKYDVPPKPNAQPEQVVEPVSAGDIPLKPPSKRGRVGKVLGWVFGGCFGLFLLFSFGLSSLFNAFSPGQSNVVDPQRQAQLNESANYFNELDAVKPSLVSFQGWMDVVWNAGLPCLEATESADVCKAATTLPMSTPDNKKVCLEVIGVAKELGAFGDVIQGETVTRALAEDETDRCISMMEAPQRSVGFAWWSPSYFLVGNTGAGTPFAIQLSLSREGVMTEDPNQLGSEHYVYQLTTSTSFDIAVPSDPQEYRFDYNKPEVQSQALLDSLAYERWMNPKRSPFDPAVADEAVASFKRNFKFEGDFEAFRGSDGNVFWLQVKTKSGFNACIATGTAEQLNAGDPENLDLTPLQTGQTGLTQLGRKVTTRAEATLLGDYYLGSCSK